MLDLRSLPYDAASFDLVYASHVLEHIDDWAALGEIFRILAPGGVAVLPVPLVVENTVEHHSPNPFEAEHVRAPGPDYFGRYSIDIGECSPMRMWYGRMMRRRAFNHTY